MSEIKLKALDHYRAASQQFDYFVLGVTGALVAYTIQHLEPKRLSFSPYAVEIAALSILIISLIVGMKSIETLIELMKLNITRLEKEDFHSNLISAIAQPRQGPLMFTGGGKVEMVNPASAAQTAQRLEIEIGVYKEEEEKLANAGGRLYRTRNRLLILGFILLAASKIIEPYFTNPQ